MPFRNAYSDACYASAYAKLEFPGTYCLAFRDLPAIFRMHVRGSRALDFGCGAGRSTRFLRSCGFDSIGVDIAADMLARAREADPTGDYRLIEEGDVGPSDAGAFDLVLSAFTFDNIPTRSTKLRTLRGIRRLLAPRGRFVNLVSSPELYTHEWASFSTKDFPENHNAKSGDIVRCVNLSTGDHRPVDDVLWSDAAYQELYELALLESVATHRPLARADELYPWVNETRIPPWVIYVLYPAVPWG